MTDAGTFSCGHHRSPENTKSKGVRAGKQRFVCRECWNAAARIRERGERAKTNKDAVIARQQETIDFLVRELARHVEEANARSERKL